MRGRMLLMNLGREEIVVISVFIIFLLVFLALCYIENSKQRKGSIIEYKKGNEPIITSRRKLQLWWSLKEMDPEHYSIAGGKKRKGP
jgi:hypothetical protein